MRRPKVNVVGIGECRYCGIGVAYRSACKSLLGRPPKHEANSVRLSLLSFRGGWTATVGEPIVAQAKRQNHEMHARTGGAFTRLLATLSPIPRDF
ncbi:hypothetical protein Pla52o_50220 [Novipirellula galeiformis]|uniref:Uncharacterized protein n=1 Tax=Novipirellula galeiformis TaxID=2528004 RepID=A0A5C6C1G2_9BACT|nr:hypothetical protein Pla52o_50220 [Novipirellula galeiformis]